MPDEDQDHVVIAAGEVSLTATAFDANDNPVAAAPTPSWASLAATIATVNATGLVTAAANGTALIVASVSGKADTAVVTVAQEAARVEIIIQPGAPLQVGGSALLVAAAFDANDNVLASPVFVWTSSSESVATVNAAGIVSAIAPGATVITVQVDSASDSVTVEVVAGP